MSINNPTPVQIQTGYSVEDRQRAICSLALLIATARVESEEALISGDEVRLTKALKEQKAVLYLASLTGVRPTEQELADAIMPPRQSFSPANPPAETAPRKNFIKKIKPVQGTLQIDETTADVVPVLPTVGDSGKKYNTASAPKATASVRRLGYEVMKKRYHGKTIQDHLAETYRLNVRQGGTRRKFARTNSYEMISIMSCVFEAWAELIGQLPETEKNTLVYIETPDLFEQIQTSAEQAGLLKHDDMKPYRSDAQHKTDLWLRNCMTQALMAATKLGLMANTARRNYEVKLKNLSNFEARFMAAKGTAPRTKVTSGRA